MLDAILSSIESQEEKALIEKLYYEYEPQMYSVAFAILQQKQDSEDAVQNAFAKIIDCLQELNLDINSQTQVLLTVITKNIALNEIKKRKKRLIHEVNIDELESISSDDLFDKIKYEEIHALIDKLPQELKSVIVMRYILDYKANNIANILNITESAVYKRIGTARKLLKDLKEECYE